MECRICYSEGNNLISPCLCKGSLKYIHYDCLQEYIKHYGNECKICLQILKADKKMNTPILILLIILDYFIIDILSYFLNIINQTEYHFMIIQSSIILTLMIFMRLHVLIIFHKVKLNLFELFILIVLSSFNIDYRWINVSLILILYLYKK